MWLEKLTISSSFLFCRVGDRDTNGKKTGPGRCGGGLEQDGAWEKYVEGSGESNPKKQIQILPNCGSMK